MPSKSPDFPSTRLRRLAVGVLLLAVPACGLSKYEEEMYKTQEREKRFRAEQIYLDKPVEMPTRKVQGKEDKEPHDVPVANVFFRPPKGIESKPKAEPRDNVMWQYPARSNQNDFLWVEMAFADDDKDQNFAKKVMNSYQAAEESTRSTYQFTLPSQEKDKDPPTIIFDTWKFRNKQYGYSSINILRSNRPIAIVYISNKPPNSVREAIEISLQSLAVGQQIGPARQRYNKGSPWELGPSE